MLGGSNRTDPCDILPLTLSTSVLLPKCTFLFEEVGVLLKSLARPSGLSSSSSTSTSFSISSSSLSFKVARRALLALKSGPLGPMDGDGKGNMRRRGRERREEREEKEIGEGGKRSRRRRKSKEENKRGGEKNEKRDRKKKTQDKG